jgi:AcrR family transcriptional regulator
MSVQTRDRLVTAAAELFMRQGLTGTGVKEILEAAGATFSSLYHHFPGGKEELAAEAIRVAGAAYEQRVTAVWDSAANPVEAVRVAFEGAAAVLENTGYADACPIETIALEVASTNERLRAASALVFASWVSAAETRLRAAGLRQSDSNRLALSIVMLLEGAFVLCRTARSTEPMSAAGDTAAEMVEAAMNRQ